jgi:hypothetical protein
MLMKTAKFTHVGLVRVGLGHGSANVSLARTCAAERRSNDVVVWRQIRRVIRLSAEHVDVVAFLHVRNVAWHRCDLRVTLAVLNWRDGYCLDRHRCSPDEDIVGLDICPHLGDSAAQVSFKAKSKLNGRLTRRE